MLKVRLNDKVIGLTEVGKSQRMIGSLRAVLRVMSLHVIQSFHGHYIE
jgi:hypothetical protein